MEKSGCLRRSDQGEGRARRAHAAGSDAPRTSVAERGRKALRDAVDRAGTWRIGEHLQLAGEGAELEAVSRSDAAGVGPGTECGLCRRGRKYRIRYGCASADPQEGAWRNSCAGRYRRVRMDRLRPV